MNNFTKYICAGLAIALLIIQAIMIWGLYGNFSGSLNELSDCTRKQLPQLIDLFTTMIVTNWVIIAALLFTLFRPSRKQDNYKLLEFLYQERRGYPQINPGRDTGFGK